MSFDFNAKQAFTHINFIRVFEKSVDEFIILRRKLNMNFCEKKNVFIFSRPPRGHFYFGLTSEE
jgi:hypothetical protein